MKRIILLLLPVAIVAASCSHYPKTATLAGQPSCCATNAHSPAPFTDKSLYQLDSTWTSDAGQSLKFGHLRGRVQVVAMFFTSCTYACPIIVQDMRRIEAALPKDVIPRVAFTLVTIDTERDTPDALRAYRMAHHLAANRWTLLHGSPDDTLELAALLGVKFKREASGQFAHSNLITVLNSQGEVLHQIAGLNQDIHEAMKRIVSTANQPPPLSAAHE